MGKNERREEGKKKVKKEGKMKRKEVSTGITVSHFRDEMR